MGVFAFSLAFLWVPVQFPEARPATRSFKEHVVLGRWFDGSRRRDAEDALWLSPQAVGRLAPDYGVVRERLNGSLAFGIRLTAFERQDPLELGGDITPGDDVSRAAIALEAIDFRGKATSLPLETVVRWSQRGRDPAELLRVAWHGFLWGDVPERLPLPVGPNQIAVYEVRTPLCPAADQAVAFRLIVTTPRRSRTALFWRWPRG